MILVTTPLDGEKEGKGATEHLHCHEGHEGRGRGGVGNLLWDSLIRGTKNGETAEGAKCICTMRFSVGLARDPTLKCLACFRLVLGTLQDNVGGPGEKHVHLRT